MNYKEILSSLSSSIYRLDESESKLSFLKKEGLAGIKTYKHNLFGLLLKSFSQDFIVTKIYLGKDNFHFFVREFILKRQIKRSCIFESSYDFSLFLKNSFETHQDELVEHLCAIDLLWADHTASSSLTAPKGLCYYWSLVSQNISPKDVTIDLDHLESICLEKVEDEKRLVVS